MSSSPKAWSNEKFVRDYCDLSAFEHWAAFVVGAAEQPRDGRPDDRCVGRGDPRRRPALCHGQEQRDLLWPGRHRAQPGHDGGDGARQPRHGDRQSRPPGRRREPAARPEQRPGLVRHGLLPARAVGLPPHLRRRHAHHVREAVGPPARCRARPAHPQHVRCRDRRHLQGHLRAGRGHPAVRSQHQARDRRRWRRWNASSSRTCS